MMFGRLIHLVFLVVFFCRISLAHASAEMRAIDVLRQTVSTVNAHSIACMAALTVDQKGSAPGQGYPDNPWGTVDTIKGFFRNPGPFCFVLSGLESKWGEKPIRLKNMKDRKLKESDCQTGVSQIEKYILESSGRMSPLKLFKKAMEITKGDSVQANALISHVLWIHSRGKDRSKDPVLNKLAPLAPLKEDFHGQFYHWWGNQALSYIYANTVFIHTAHDQSTAAYEVLPVITGNSPDYGDLMVDGNAKSSGFLQMCLVKLFENVPKRSWYHQLNCDAVAEGDENSTSGFISADVLSIKNIALHPVCSALLSQFRLVRSASTEPFVPSTVDSAGPARSE